MPTSPVGGPGLVNKERTMPGAPILGRRIDRQLPFQGRRQRALVKHLAAGWDDGEARKKQVGKDADRGGNGGDG